MGYSQCVTRIRSRLCAPRALHRIERTALKGDHFKHRIARAAARATGTFCQLLYRQVDPVDFDHQQASRVPV